VGGVDAKSRESERPVQSHELVPAESTSPTPVGGTPDAWLGGPAPAPGPRRNRKVIAIIVALAADTLQIALLPLVLGGAISPVNDMIDVVTAIALTALIGWHWAFLPTFIAEILPVVDLVPSWTLAVFIATRGRDRKLTHS
jgi:hypothetical protein